MTPGSKFVKSIMEKMGFDQRLIEKVVNGIETEDSE